MIILDSNVWVAWLDESDGQRGRAVKLVNSLEERLAITEYIILEVCTVLLIKAGKRAANRFLEIALDNREVEVILSDPVFFTATTELFRLISSEKLSFVDASLLRLADRFKVVTFDKELQKALAGRPTSRINGINS